MATLPRMKPWLPFSVLAVLSWKRAYLSSPSSIAWHLSQFEAQTRFMMGKVWARILHGYRSVIAGLVICGMLGSCVPPLELPYHVPRAWVCVRPPIVVDPNARVFAHHAASNTWASDNDSDPDDFSAFAQNADTIFFFDSTARPESVAALPIPYNMMSCDNPNALLPRAVYFGQRLPHSNELPLAEAGRVHFQTTLEDASVLNRRFVGMPDAPSKRGPEIIHVCTHPPDVRADAVEWLFTTEKVGASYTQDAELYARLRATAQRVFVYDADAPGESVLRFVAPYNRLRCPGKPLIGDTSDEADKKAAFDALVVAVMAKASVSEFGGSGGSDKRTWTSTPEGQGASLSFFETVVRQMVIAGAFQSGDVSGNLKDSNGSRHGIPTGKNVGGPDSLALQMAAGTFMMLANPLRTTKALGQKIVKAARQKGILIIADVKLFPEAIAKQLIKDYGESMAPSLHQTQTIMPFSRASMFTKGWESLYQAHKILEKDMWKKAFGREDFEDLPAIILKDAEHKKMTKTLNEVRNAWLDLQAKMKPRETPTITPEGLWEIYQVAYADHPTWRRSIASYFGK